MNELSRLAVVISARTDQFHKGMDGVASKMDRVSKQMKIAGGIMVAAIAAIGVASLKMGADFDGAMREVNTMILLNEDEFRVLSKDVQNLAREMGVNAVGMAHALYQAISAGVPRENVIDFLRVATKAAIGSVTDTTTAVDGLTTIINAYKLPVSEAERVSDALFTTVTGGKTTFAELAVSMSQAMPTAAALGVGYEQILAAVATMTKQGVPTAQAFTQIRQALVALMKPTAEMSEVIQGLGYESGEAMLQTLGYVGTLEALMEATGGNNEMMGKMFGSAEAISAVMLLTGENIQMATADLDAMANSAGATQAAVDQMEMSTGRQFEKLKVRLQDVAITIGMALMPALIKLLKAITPIISKIGEWISEHSELTIKILAGVAALGGLMLLAGPLLSTIRLIRGAFVALKVAMIAVKTHATLMWGAITLGISLIVVGIIELVNHLGKAKREIKDLANTMQAEMKSATDMMIANIKQENQVLIDSINDRRRLWKEAHFERMNQLNEQFWAELKAISPEKFEKLLPLYQEWLGLQEDIADITREQTELRAEQIEQELKGPDLAEETKKQLEKELAYIKAQGIEIKVAAELAEIPEPVIDAYFDPIVSAAETAASGAVQAVEDIQDEWLEALQLPHDELLKWLETNWKSKYIDILKGVGLEPSVTELPEPPEPPLTPLEQLYPGGYPFPPRMQFGGIVRSPTLAMVGEGGPEAVIPLDQLGSVSSKTTELHIHVGNFMGDEISLRKFARQLKQVLGEEERRTQFVPIQGENYYNSGRASL